MKNYYEVLGVSQKVSQEEIKSAYQKMVKEYHPDKYRNNPLQSLAEEKMREINEAYEVLGNPEDRRDYDEGAAIGPDEDEIEIINLFQRGEEFLSRRQFDSARAEFEKVLDLNPSVGNAYFMIGLCYRNQEKLELAIITFEKGLKIFPDAHEAYNQIGICYLKQENTKEAIYYFKKASTLAPEESLYLENTGHALNTAKKPQEALEYFNKAINLAPDRADVYMEMCYICTEQGWHEKSENYYKTAKRVDPNHPLVLEWEELLRQYQNKQQQYLATTGSSNNGPDELLTCMAGCCLAGLMESMCPGSSHCLRCGG